MSAAMSDPMSGDRPPWRLWIFAGIGALAIHLGCAALAIAHLPSDDEGDSLGATAIEIGLDMTSPQAEATDLPPGPDTDASMASPALAEQKAQLKETTLPKDTPVESENPDQVVSENDSKKPNPDDPKVQTVQTAASTESVAQEATAQQTLEDAQKGETLAAPNIGIGKDKQRLIADWGRQISAYFQLHKRYPKVDKNKNALVKVALVLNRLGNVLSVDVLESSGDPLFDDAAISMIRRSDPVPRPPAKLTDERFNYSLDVRFNDKK